MSETRPGHNRESEATPEGWHEETAIRTQFLKDFLARHFQSDISERKDYGAGLHFSGGGGNVNYLDISGQVVKIEALYEQGKVTQIHAMLREQGKEMGATDVYLTGKALEDYMALEMEDPNESLEDLKKIVDEQEREREKPMEDAAREDMDTERIIKNMEDSDRGRKDEGTDPVE
jgi:hypothetical protein